MLKPLLRIVLGICLITAEIPQAGASLITQTSNALVRPQMFQTQALATAALTFRQTFNHMKSVWVARQASWRQTHIPSATGLVRALVLIIGTATMIWGSYFNAQTLAPSTSLTGTSKTSGQFSFLFPSILRRWTDTQLEEIGYRRVLFPLLIVFYFTLWTNPLDSAASHLIKLVVSGIVATFTQAFLWTTRHRSVTKSERVHLAIAGVILQFVTLFRPRLARDLHDLNNALYWFHHGSERTPSEPMPLPFGLYDAMVDKHPFLMTWFSGNVLMSTEHSGPKRTNGSLPGRTFALVHAQAKVSLGDLRVFLEQTVIPSLRHDPEHPVLSGEKRWSIANQSRMNYAQWFGPNERWAIVPPTQGVPARMIPWSVWMNTIKHLVDSNEISESAATKVMGLAYVTQTDSFSRLTFPQAFWGSTDRPGSDFLITGRGSYLEMKDADEPEAADFGPIDEVVGRARRGDKNSMKFFGASLVTVAEVNRIKLAPEFAKASPSKRWVWLPRGSLFPSDLWWEHVDSYLSTLDPRDRPKARRALYGFAREVHRDSQDRIQIDPDLRFKTLWLLGRGAYIQAKSAGSSIELDAIPETVLRLADLATADNVFLGFFTTLLAKEGRTMIPSAFKSEAPGLKRVFLLGRRNSLYLVPESDRIKQQLRLNEWTHFSAGVDQNGKITIPEALRQMMGWNATPVELQWISSGGLIEVKRFDPQDSRDSPDPSLTHARETILASCGPSAQKGSFFSGSFDVSSLFGRIKLPSAWSATQKQWVIVPIDSSNWLIRRSLWLSAVQAYLRDHPDAPLSIRQSLYGGVCPVEEDSQGRLTIPDFRNTTVRLVGAGAYIKIENEVSRQETTLQHQAMSRVAQRWPESPSASRIHRRLNSSRRLTLPISMSGRCALVSLADRLLLLPQSAYSQVVEELIQESPQERLHSRASYYGMAKMVTIDKSQRMTVPQDLLQVFRTARSKDVTLEITEIGGFTSLRGTRDTNSVISLRPLPVRTPRLTPDRVSLAAT